MLFERIARGLAIDIDPPPAPFADFDLRSRALIRRVELPPDRRFAGCRYRCRIGRLGKIELFPRYAPILDQGDAAPPIVAGPQSSIDLNLLVIEGERPSP